ncbi:hypothetical protein GLOIN_2v1847196 [Rhizophagus clarus]|uniref:Uncharacterized protein n=1 Tax=Rhizophagus clarus TaxID=94130 RepID=A0A8H3LQT9_9GLOM|nr:hypothetical protein GLOIN_2v1847196 [Rhizophagus clarus]
MLSLSNSDERGARFNLNSSTLYPICNGDHKEETIWNNIKGEWGSGNCSNTNQKNPQCCWFSCMRKSPAKVYVLPSHAISSHLTTLVERWNLGKARQSVSDKRYLKYFVKKSSKHWSLRDFDCWALNYVKNCQQDAKSKLIGTKKEDLKNVNRLWKTPEVLKNINKLDKIINIEEEQKLDKIVNIEEEERIMALKECQLQLREREAKIRTLELHNIRMEKEIGGRVDS